MDYIIKRIDNFFYDYVEDLFSNITCSIFYELETAKKVLYSLQKFGHDVSLYTVEMEKIK